VLRVRIDPAPSEWSRLVASSPGFGSDRAKAFREQLGLPTDRPIIMTGHQPQFWHPGILVKFLACQASSSIGAPVWIVPDQDEIDPASVRVPVLDEKDALHIKRIALAPPSPPGVAVASLPPIEPASLGDLRVALPAAEAGIRAVRDAMAAHKDEQTLARQAQAALNDLLAPIVPASPTIFASELHATDLFASMLSKMAHDPEPMARAYNDAVSMHPDAGVQKLIANEVHDRWELPLWRLQPGEPRRRVYAEQALDIPREQLAPRALLMTALLRLAGCDLFIHGAGGEAYDRVTEQWIGAWLGKSLAPSAAATATLRLPLRDSIPSDEEVAHATWRAHAAWHNPVIFGQADLEAKKLDLARRINETGRGSPARDALFRQMHALLVEYRDANRDALDAASATARALHAAAGEREIVMDRTWAFPLYGEDALQSLKLEIDEAFAKASSVAS
jgi:hypothetical protein